MLVLIECDKPDIKAQCEKKSHRLRVVFGIWWICMTHCQNLVGFCAFEILFCDAFMLTNFASVLCYNGRVTARA